MPATSDEKMLAEYLHCPVLDIFDLCITDYYSLLRDALIYNLDSHEEGRKALGVAWRTEIFGGKMDRDLMRKIASGQLKAENAPS